MKRKLLSVISVLFAVMMFLCISVSGCTTEVSEIISSIRGNGSTTDESSGIIAGDVTVDRTGANDDAFTVTLVFPSTAYMPTDTELEATEVQWIGTNENEVYSAYFNSTGFAYCNECDGEYTVQIIGMFSNFSYNPNGYSATNTAAGREIEITMYQLSSWGNTYDGTSPKDNYYQEIKGTGVYRITYTEYMANATNGYGGFFFQFNMSGSTTGKQYSLETWVNITEDNLVMEFEYYYWSTRTYKETLTGYSSYCGKNTKNLLLDITESATSGGGHNPWICHFIATAMDGVYPQYIDFIITYEGVYSSGSYEEAQLEEYNTEYTEKTYYEENGETDSLGTYTPLVSLLTSGLKQGQTVSLTSFQETDADGNRVDTNISYCASGTLTHTSYDEETGSTYQTITYGYDADGNQVTVRTDASTETIAAARATVVSTLDKGFYYLWYNSKWNKLFSEMNDCYYGKYVASTKANQLIYNFFTDRYVLIIAGYGDDFGGILTYYTVMKYYKETAIPVSWDNIAGSGSYDKEEDALLVHPVTSQLEYMIRAYSCCWELFKDGSGKLETMAYDDFNYYLTTDDAHLFLYCCGIFI